MAAIRDTQLYTTWRRKAQGGLLAAPRGKGDVDDEGRGVCWLLGSVDALEQAVDCPEHSGHQPPLFFIVRASWSVGVC